MIPVLKQITKKPTSGAVMREKAPKAVTRAPEVTTDAPPQPPSLVPVGCIIQLVNTFLY